MPDEQVQALGQDLSKIQAIVKAMNLEQQNVAKNKATEKKVIVTDPTKVWPQAHKDNNAVANVEEGTVLKAVGKEGKWLKVQPFDLDYTQGIWDQGYVEIDKVVSADDSGDLYDMLVKSVEEMRQKYKSNPYISVSGFTVSVGIPPSVDIQFDFK
ncbi:MAG TPA: hypothetical protein VFG64_11685 [Dongiaceae bacterium]|nr:hypothetical protein [Dongiaceae bacterium]